MRKLIVIPSPLIVRDFLAAGAFSEVNDSHTYYLSGPLPGLDTPIEEVLGDAQFLGEVPIDDSRKRAYSEIRTLLLTSYRFRSRTSRMKLKELPLRDRVRAKLEAAPLVRQIKIRRRLKQTGLHPTVHGAIRDIRPDVVIVVSRGPGGDVVVTDAMRSARVFGVPVLALTNNWDNLSSKNAFVVAPDYLGAIGHQSADHASRIHRVPQGRVRVIGSPYIDGHFRRTPGSTESPFGFPYVLFAGCYRPFDELRALEELDRTIEEAGLNLKIVYLPHPRRVQRSRADFVDEVKLRHVIIEPHVREDYLDSWTQESGAWRQTRKIARTKPLPVGKYPALLENAEFVVCPLSTMMLEAAIFGRRVLAIAYHDGIHRTSPGYTSKYLHFERMDSVETFSVCRNEGDMPALFRSMAADPQPSRRPPKEQIDYFIYHDDQPFSARLRQFVDDVVGETGGPAEKGAATRSDAFARSG